MNEVIELDYTNRPPAYDEDGMVYYRASSLGSCLRMLAMWRQGYEPLPPSAKMLAVYAAGHEAERQVWTKGWIPADAWSQRPVWLPISSRITVVGHLDAWWRGEIWEVKSQSEAEWKPIRLSPLWEQYSWQISVYMLALQNNLTVIRVLRDKAGMVVDRVDEEFDKPPHTLAEVRQRVFDVERLARRDLDGVECSKVVFPCPFFYTHKREEDREKIDDESAVVLAREYKMAQREKVAVDGRLKAARTALLTFMGDRSKIEVGGYKLTRSFVDAKRVEYDRQAYEVLKVTEPKSSDPTGERDEAGTADM